MPKANRLSPAAVAFLKERQIANIATVSASGQPQVTPLWVDVEDDGEHVLINTSVGRVKDVNATANPRVAISVVDPNNAHRTLQLQGRVVERRLEGAEEHLNSLSWKYNDRPYNFHTGLKRVIWRIRPTTVIEGRLETGPESGGYALHTSSR
ncbi:MAG: hypothetical protein QOF51_3799 [Chloroflexota bacterium]|jgi:PPOX class probable F420-dependent enzyme|nr:hypothetical protein [Chloroflexota bacterium]